MGNPELAPAPVPAERKPTEAELDQLERAAGSPHLVDTDELLEEQESVEDRYREDADQIIAQGAELIHTAEDKVLDQNARKRGFQRYLDALSTLHHLDPNSETWQVVRSDITWALHARQDPTAALIWALDKSGLVVNDTEATAS